jgi:hypothetical protein
MRRIVSLFLIVGLFLAVATSPTLADTSDTRTMTYDVFLDGKKIGYHRFEIDGSESDAAVRSEASFDVKVLFLTAFKYRHVTNESWTGGCLDEIEAQTNSNGKRLQLSGELTESGFVIDTGEQEAELPECVMTFAYWNPGFLNEPRLLNPQTGEYLDVDVTELGHDVVKIAGREVPARSVRVTARKMDITLWYSADRQWLALESVAKGGRIIRYELS